MKNDDDDFNLANKLKKKTLFFHTAAIAMMIHMIHVHIDNNRKIIILFISFHYISFKFFYTIFQKFIHLHLKHTHTQIYMTGKLAFVK